MAFYAIKQSSTAYPLVFLMVDSSDHRSGKTGLSPTVKIGKAGATGVSPAGAISEIDATNLPGWYAVAGNATDSNTLGSLILHASAAGADPADYVYEVVAVDPQAVGYGLTLGTNAIPAAAVDPLAAQKITDILLARSVSNVETSSAEHSLATLILMALESVANGGTLTIKQTDGATTYLTKTLTTDATAVPITGIQ